MNRHTTTFALLALACVLGIIGATNYDHLMICTPEIGMCDIDVTERAGITNEDSVDERNRKFSDYVQTPNETFKNEQFDTIAQRSPVTTMTVSLHPLDIRVSYTTYNATAVGVKLPHWPELLFTKNNGRPSNAGTWEYVSDEATPAQAGGSASSRRRRSTSGRAPGCTHDGRHYQACYYDHYDCPLYYYLKYVAVLVDWPLNCYPVPPLWRSTNIYMRPMPSDAVGGSPDALPYWMSEYAREHLPRGMPDREIRAHLEERRRRASAPTTTLTTTTTLAPLSDSDYDELLICPPTTEFPICDIDVTERCNITSEDSTQVRVQKFLRYYNNQPSLIGRQVNVIGQRAVSEFYGMTIGIQPPMDVTLMIIRTSPTMMEVYPYQEPTKVFTYNAATSTWQYDALRRIGE